MHRIISTAFDLESSAFLETLDLSFYKTPSGEITNGLLLLAFAQTGKRIVLSTEMANLGEVVQALAILSWGYAQSRKPTSLKEIWRYWSGSENPEILQAKYLFFTARLNILLP
jgi:N-acetylneuraminate synthase